MYKMYFLFIYIILFHSLAVYEVMLYLKYTQNQSNVYILFISFFFFEWKIECMQLRTRKFILSVLSLWWKYFICSSLCSMFSKRKIPPYIIIMTISSLCKKCYFGGKGYILEFRAFGSKMKIKKNFTCTYIKRKQISTCTVKIWWFLGGYFDPYHTYIVLEQFFCTEIQKWNKWSGLHTSISTQS